MSFWQPGVSATKAKDSVRDDWRAALPDDRKRQFDAISAQWEATYSMLSVTLNEAFALRDAGTLVRAREQAAVAADLVDRLAADLVHALQALRAKGWSSDPVPAVEPLHPKNFRGDSSQSHAAGNLFLHRVLPSRRARFLLKVRKLEAAVSRLAEDFRGPADEIAEGASVEPSASWHTLELAHDDLNTMMRESIVVLKSFLRAVSDGRFTAFRQCMARAGRRAPLRARPGFSRASS